jgi:peptidyl-prolyl cis-trans isomerase A (cyclophilin A)
MRSIFCFLFLLLIASCHRTAFKEKWLKEKAPAQFTAGFETSKGYFEAEFTREWSPLAVDRLYAQIKHGFYNQTLFYRVRPNFVAQFGAHDSVKIRNWTREKIPDEPVRKTNERGTISFARSGKDSRSSNVFINLKNNSPRLDTIMSSGIQGYPGLGTVTQGMSVVDSLYSGYGDEVFSKYNELLRNKQLFLQSFPKLDSIQRVFLVRKK